MWMGIRLARVAFAEEDLVILDWNYARASLISSMLYLIAVSRLVFSICVGLPRTDEWRGLDGDVLLGGRGDGHGGDDRRRRGATVGDLRA